MGLIKWKFQRGGGGGGGLNQKTFHGRGMDIFWNNTIHMQHESFLVYEHLLKYRKIPVISHIE